MKIVIREFQDESYENCIGAELIFDSYKVENSILESISFGNVTSKEFDSFVSKWKGVAEVEDVSFYVEIKEEEVRKELKDMDAELISVVEDGGDELSNYPVDESQTISNAGDAVQYMYEGKLYEIITWNECADEHEPESKTISELEY